MSAERIATLSAQLEAASYQLLVMIRRFDERGGCNRGFRSCAHWLCWRTGLELGAAREKVRSPAHSPTCPCSRRRCAMGSSPSRRYGR